MFLSFCEVNENNMERCFMKVILLLNICLTRNHDKSEIAKKIILPFCDMSCKFQQHNQLELYSLQNMLDLVPSCRIDFVKYEWSSILGEYPRFDELGNCLRKKSL